jgi:hypothetical protein
LETCSIARFGTAGAAVAGAAENAKPMLPAKAKAARRIVISFEVWEASDEGDPSAIPSPR